MDGFRNLDLPELKLRISLLNISPTFKFHTTTTCVSFFWGGEDSTLYLRLKQHLFGWLCKRSIFWKKLKSTSGHLSWICLRCFEKSSKHILPNGGFFNGDLPGTIRKTSPSNLNPSSWEVTKNNTTIPVKLHHNHESGCFFKWWYPHFTPQMLIIFSRKTPWGCWGNPPF